MGALGSVDNERNFYILEAEVNGVKSLVSYGRGTYTFE
jgi:hypothetical protein